MPYMNLHRYQKLCIALLLEHGRLSAKALASINLRQGSCQVLSYTLCGALFVQLWLLLCLRAFTPFGSCCCLCLVHVVVAAKPITASAQADTKLASLEANSVTKGNPASPVQMWHWAKPCQCLPGLTAQQTWSTAYEGLHHHLCIQILCFDMHGTYSLFVNGCLHSQIIHS